MHGREPALTTVIDPTVGATASQPRVEPLPAGSRIVHVGPPKTGTTALQAALHRSRAALLEQGVRYAGRSRHSRRAAEAVVGRRPPHADAPPPIGQWRALAAEVQAAHEARVVVSSEILAGATPGQIRRVVDDLGGIERVQVVVTLRPIARIIPSHWQQLIQSGRWIAYDEFVRLLLDPSPGESARQFWWRHRHDELIRRWADVVGLDRVTAIVVDDSRHDVLLRSFEALLDLRPGSLEPDDVLVNRSLTAPEAAAMRSFNLAYRATGLGRRTYRRVMYTGGRRAIKARVPPREEPRIALPAWAAEQIADVTDEVVDGVAATGVRRIGGDLELLRAVAVAPGAGPDAGPDASPDADATTGGLVPAEIASAMALGVLEGARRDAAAHVKLQSVSSRRMARALLRRARARATARIGRLLNRGGRRTRGRRPKA